MVLKGATLRYFKLLFGSLKTVVNWKRQRDKKETRINQKGTRMVKDGED